MPIYEYKCENGHVFDVIQRISEDPLSVCTVCNAPVKKVLHPVNIAFKGSGFYSTDYSGNGRGADKSGSEKSGSDSGSSTGSTESGSSEKSSSSGKNSEGSSTKKSA